MIKRIGPVLHFIVIFTFVILLFSGNAGAYVDPGTGSYILQIILAGLVGAAFTLKLFWRRIKVFISDNIRRRKSSGEEDGPAGEDE